MRRFGKIIGMSAGRQSLSAVADGRHTKGFPLTREFFVEEFFIGHHTEKVFRTIFF